MNERLKEVYFIIAMASHILALSLFVPELSDYQLGFSVALSLPVVYTVKTYQRRIYLRKGKYFALRKEWEERIVDEIALLIMSIVVGYALFVSFGGRDFRWFLTGFSSAWALRLFTFRVVDRLKDAGIPVEKPPVILIIGYILGMVIGSFVGLVFSIIFS